VPSSKWFGYWFREVPGNVTKAIRKLRTTVKSENNEAHEPLSLYVGGGPWYRFRISSATGASVFDFPNAAAAAKVLENLESRIED